MLPSDSFTTRSEVCPQEERSLTGLPDSGAFGRARSQAGASRGYPSFGKPAVYSNVFIGSELPRASLAVMQGTQVAAVCADPWSERWVHLLELESPILTAFIRRVGA